MTLDYTVLHIQCIHVSINHFSSYSFSSKICISMCIPRLRGWNWNFLDSRRQVRERRRTWDSRKGLGENFEDHNLIVIAEAMHLSCSSDVNYLFWNSLKMLRVVDYTYNLRFYSGRYYWALTSSIFSARILNINFIRNVVLLFCMNVHENFIQY